MIIVRSFCARSLAMRAKGLFCILLVSAAAVTSARAQVSASIAGVISDTSGARVPAALVAIRNLETGAIRDSVTDDAGRYQLLALPVGDYELRVSKVGFQEQVRIGIHLVV